jgi:hypothetical protein
LPGLQTKFFWRCVRNAFCPSRNAIFFAKQRLRNSPPAILATAVDNAGKHKLNQFTYQGDRYETFLFDPQQFDFQPY